MTVSWALASAVPEQPTLWGGVGRVFLVLGLLAAAAWAARRWAARGPKALASPLRVTHRAAISRNANVAIVEVDGRRLLVGAADHGVTHLAELDPVTEGDPEDVGDAGEAQTSPLRLLRDATVRRSEDIG